jgi:hypothetical protein
VTSLRACVAGGVLGLAASPVATEVTCFAHSEIGGLPGTQWGTAGPAVGEEEKQGKVMDFGRAAAASA